MATATEAEHAPARVEPLLEPKLHPQWALSARHLLLIAGWCLFFYTLNCFPLRQTDLWGHVAYGEWILQHRELPAEDPFVPVFQGMRSVDTAWLSQVLYALAYRGGGGEAFSAIFALTILASYLVLARTFYLQTRSLGITHFALLLVLVVGWSRISTIRPENFGELFFALLLWLIVSSGNSAAAGDGEPASRAASLRFWLGIPALMLIWANMHGSFVCGFMVLACFGAGAVLETAWETKSLRAVLADRRVRRWLLVGELALAATLINPYGMDLLLQTTWFANNENLHEVSEWQPVIILDVGGREFALSAVLLMFLFRHSRRRVAVSHVLLLALFGATVIRGVRMIWWYAAVFGVAAAPHVLDVWRRLQAWWAARNANGAEARWAGSPGTVAPPARRQYLTGLVAVWSALGRRSWRYSMVGLLLVWTAFALSPMGRRMLGDEPRPPDKLMADATPWKLTEYLRQQPPPPGQLFNPQWWGDWLQWDGPPGLKLFMTTNMHLAPRQIWREYRIVRETRAGWNNVLNRHNVRTMVLHKQEQTVLLGYLRTSREWRAVYEDEIAIVFVRKGTPRTRSGPTTGGGAVMNGDTMTRGQGSRLGRFLIVQVLVLGALAGLGAQAAADLSRRRPGCRRCGTSRGRLRRCTTTIRWCPMNSCSGCCGGSARGCTAGRRMSTTSIMPCGAGRWTPTSTSPDSFPAGRCGGC